jgi:hypothetical protein
MAGGHELNDGLKDKIKKTLKENTSHGMYRRPAPKS